jgi:cytochrome c551/c552
MMTRIAAALLFGALALSPGLSQAADDSSSLETAIQAAQTPAQHAALAENYRAKAKEARAQAARHENMGSMYLPQKSSMGSHCKNIASKYAGIADDYDALAKGEEEAAKAK